MAMKLDSVDSEVIYKTKAEGADQAAGYTRGCDSLI